MIIDFHTHVFPDAMAEKTIAHLSHKGGIPSFSDGTTAALSGQMAAAGVDLAINLPVLTNPDKFESVNAYAAGLNRDQKSSTNRLISFGAIHPKCDDIEEKMAWLAEQGFLGVKIHPDYQETFFDDEGYLRILAAAKRHGLIVLTHAGLDCAFYGQPVRCTPERARRVIEAIPYRKLVLAHLGGIAMLDGVLELLCGQDVYFDTAYILRYTAKEDFCRVVQKHGADRILFASDSPWSHIGDDVARLCSLSPDDQTQEKILGQNARILLGI